MPLRDDDSRDFFPDYRDSDSRDHEDPDPGDMTAPDDFSTVRCNHCGKLIFEDAPRCPYCRHWQSDAAPRKPLWFVAAVIFCIIAVLLWLFRSYW